MKNNKKLFGAAATSHAKKVCAERKAKAVIASIKSVQKRKANMTPEELAVWRKKQSEASMKSYKNRLAKMTPEELAAFKAARNAKAKARRAATLDTRMAKAADAAIAQLTNNEVNAAC